MFVVCFTKFDSSRAGGLGRHWGFAPAPLWTWALLAPMVQSNAAQGLVVSLVGWDGCGCVCVGGCIGRPFLLNVPQNLTAPKLEGLVVIGDLPPPPVDVGLVGPNGLEHWRSRAVGLGCHLGALGDHFCCMFHKI